MSTFFHEFWPIALLLLVVGVVIALLPKTEIRHDPAFRRRRILNWLPLGLTYAFLYMGRYNLEVSKLAFVDMKGAGGGALMGNADFAQIFGIGTLIYGLAFIVNGPLTDRLGGKFAILMGAGGAALANMVMGLATWSLLEQGPLSDLIAGRFTTIFTILYGANMYFQSFGAVAVVKTNAPWFHVRERGVFGAIFGILISLGIYFAFDLSRLILGPLNRGLVWVFFTPALILGIFWVIDVLVVKNSPGEAGLTDFDTADASSGDIGPLLPVTDVFLMMLRSPIIMTIAGIEFCSGFLRQAIMQWFRTFAKQTDVALHLGKGSFVFEHWGMLLCVAGILGGTIAGIISDHLFQSRRGPVAGVLYAVMLTGGIFLCFTYPYASTGWLVIAMSTAVIGVHWMLSGTASMDFGGKKNVGVAVGIIDGFVYLGTAAMSLTYGLILPKDQLATQPENWLGWPLAMVPVALLGFLLTLRVWNAKPKGQAPAGH